MSGLEGHIGDAGSHGNLMTLDEPVLETVRRDLRRIAVKVRYVMMPSSTSEETISELKNWDLWGPLLLCLVLSVMLSYAAPSDQASTAFASVFVIVWCGAFVVTLNAQFLGGKISNFQSVCVLGYCVFPLVLSAILCSIWGNPIWKAIVVLFGLAWSTRASVVFMGQLVPVEKRILATYPVVLFYIVIGWMVFVSM